MNFLVVYVDDEKQYVNVDQITSVVFKDSQELFVMYLSDGRKLDCTYRMISSSSGRRINYKASHQLRNEIIDVDIIDY